MIEHPALACAALIGSIFLLTRGAKWVVLSSARIARRFGLSDLVIGLTVVALGTSAPEFVVTVLAAIEGQPEMAVGNVVGSNIFNTGLVLGLCALLWRVPIAVDLVRRDVPLLLLSTVGLLLLLRDGRLDRLEGLCLFVALVLYLAWLVRRGSVSGVVLEEIPREPARARDGLLLLGGLAFVCAGAELLVESAVYLATELGASEWLIGVTIVAAGTSLPEFATSIMAGRHGHRGIILGNLVGSDLFNLLGVLGLAGLLRPLDVRGVPWADLWMMVGAVGVLLLVVLRRRHMPPLAGVVLIAIALGRWGFSAYSASP